LRPPALRPPWLGNRKGCPYVGSLLSIPQVNAQKRDASALGPAAPYNRQALWYVALKLARFEIRKPPLCPWLPLIAFPIALNERNEDGPARPQRPF
jgi:hypothetical protein